MTATYIVHWPGNEVPACDLHAEKLTRLAHFMGFLISMTACREERACTNCENEAKVVAGKQDK